MPLKDHLESMICGLCLDAIIVYSCADGAFRRIKKVVQ